MATHIPQLEGNGSSCPGLSHFPDELLLDIFDYFVTDDNSPWHLTLICRRWRAITLSAAEFWTAINIDETDSSTTTWTTPSGISAASSGSTTVCRSPAELEHALGRARSSPIDLEVTSVSAIDTWCAPFERSTGLRLRSLKLQALLFSDEFPLLPTISQSMDLNNLEEFQTPSAGNFPPALLMAVRDGPRFIRLGVPTDLLNQFTEGYSELQLRLQHLTLEYTPDFNPRILEDNMSKYRNLRSLEIIIVDWPHCQSPEISFELLEALKIQCGASHLPKLNKLASLRTLDVVVKPNECSCPLEDAKKTLSFPHLTRLGITLLQEMETSWIRQFEVPSLKELDLVWSVAPPLSPLVMPAAPHLERFSFFTYTPFALGEETFGPIGSVNHLVFKSLSGDLALCKQVLQMLVTKKPCPLLRTLYLDYFSVYQPEMDIFHQQIVDTDLEKQRFLEYIDVNWADRGIQRYKPGLYRNMQA